MALEPSRGDSVVVLLKKIVLLSGCPGVDCCGFQTEQTLLYLWASCMCADCGGEGPTPPPPPSDENLLLLENTDPFELEDNSGGILVEP